MKILIIDDNKAIRTSLKMILAPHFPNILTVGDPTLIPALLIAGDIDAVLLDMNFGSDRLDGSDGIFWLHKIKEFKDGPAVLLITAFGDLPLAVETMKMGADDFITKPWDNEELIEKIKSAVIHNREKKLRANSLDKARDIVRRENDRRKLTLEEMKIQHIRETVESCEGNLSLASRRLGINRQTLYNLLRKQ